jgi:transcriptional antiterminator Rof (Rho-off)
MKTKAPGALLLVLTVVSGCSSSASFTLRDGRHTSGRIVESDKDAVLVEKDGALWLLRRDDIADVSHPGTGELVVGGVLLGLVGLVAVDDFSTPQDCGEEPHYFCFGQGAATLFAGIFLGIPGLILGIDGLATSSGSRSRYSATSGGHLIQLQPTPSTAPASGPPPSRWCATPQAKRSCESRGGECRALGSTSVCVMPGTTAPQAPVPPSESAPDDEPNPSAPADEPNPSAPADEPDPSAPTVPPADSKSAAPSPWCQLRGCP